MENFLDQTFLDNSFRDYAWFLGTILTVLLIGRPVSGLLGKLVYPMFRKLSTENRADAFLKLVIRPTTRFVILVAIYLSFSFIRYPEALDLNIYNVHVSNILNKLYLILLAYAITRLLIRVVDFVSLVMMEKAALTDSRSDDQLILFLKDVAKVMVVFCIIFFALNVILEINITSLLAGAGIAGLAIAFAAKESLENLFGSFAIFLEKPFSVGDFIQVGDVIGTVEKVGFRSTRIRTLDKTFVTLPNRKLSDSYSENLTMRTFRRVKTFIGVTYSTTPEQIRSIVREIQGLLDQHPSTNQDGIVGFHEFGDSALQVLVNYYISELDWNKYVKVREEINYQIMEIVMRNGADFAFPTRTIHTIQENPK